MERSATATRPDAVQAFSTHGLRGPQRVELWEQHNARALIGLHARTLNGLPLEVTELNLQLAHLQFAQVTASPHVIERDARQITLNPAEAVALYFTLNGESFFYHEEGVHLQRPGELLVCDVGQPFMRGFARGLKEFVLTIPRAIFEESGVSISVP